MALVGLIDRHVIRFKDFAGGSFQRDIGQRLPELSLTTEQIIRDKWEQHWKGISGAPVFLTSGGEGLAGIITDANPAMSNGLLALLQHRDQLERLLADPGLVGTAVEELLRFDSPVQRTARITNAEVELGGKVLPKGAFVIAAIGAANRDPAHFPDPDRLDVARADNRHIAFGFGIHFCLGAPLARVEGQIALESLLRRMPRLRLTGSVPEWRESSTLRGLRALPVTF